MCIRNVLVSFQYIDMTCLISKCQIIILRKEMNDRKYFLRNEIDNRKHFLRNEINDGINFLRNEMNTEYITHQMNS
jgi:hypothetical protein